MPDSVAKSASVSAVLKSDIEPDTVFDPRAIVLVVNVWESEVPTIAPETPCVVVNAAWLDTEFPTNEVLARFCIAVATEDVVASSEVSVIPCTFVVVALWLETEFPTKEVLAKFCMAVPTYDVVARAPVSVIPCTLVVVAL